MAAALDTVLGLERLNGLATINVNQLVSSYKGNNYTVLSEEEVLFDLIEETEGLGLFSGGSRRGFHINGVDNTGKKVFSLRRPGMSLSDKIELFLNDALVSVVRLESTFLKPIFSINDAQDCPTLRIKGKMTDTANYKLQTKTKTVIGGIHKRTHVSLKEMISRNDDYIVTFPVDLALHFKLAVIVGCVFIDFRFHEGK